MSALAHTFVVTIWVVIQITLFVIIITFIMILKMTLPEKGFTPKLAYFDETKLKTGDIICSSNSLFNSQMNQLIIGSKWSHACLVWIDPKTNVPYILEGSNYKGKEYTVKFFKIPFNLWMKINRRCSFCVIEINKPADPHKIIEEFNKYVKYSTLEVFSFEWYRFFQDKEYRPYTEEDYTLPYTCIEAIIRTLQEAGVYKKIKLESSYNPLHILNSSIPCDNGFKYGKPTLMCRGLKWYTGNIPT
jgi:hypothetical protein